MLEISGTDGFTTASKVFQIDIASSGRIYQDNAKEERSARKLQNCVATVPDFEIQELTIFAAGYDYEWPSFSELDNCNYDYSFDYGVLNDFGSTVVTCSAYEYKPYV